MNSFLSVMFSFVFGAICIAFFINSTSDVLAFNVISYIWPILFLLGIVFGILILKNFKTNRLFDNIIALMIICLCVPCLGYYGFLLYLAKVMGT